MTSDYTCNSCNLKFEYVKTISENFPESPECPHCNSFNTKRIWMVGGVSVSIGNLGNGKVGFK